MHDLSGIDPLINTTLDGRYRILRAIGEGGMGVVYEAEHVLIEKRVAIKVLRESFTRRPDVVERFRQEAKSASRIGHPNIVDVSDFGETPNRASYIVMEMLKGEDLADILTRECALAPTRAVTIVYQVAKALAAAHKKNIIHRDLKPENIYLIEREGQPDFVKVVDFGVAKMSDIETLGGRKLTRTGMIFGTPEYMSPEHAGGKSLDHRVDIYAVGVILYELLTGRVPFEGDNFMEVLSKHGHDPVPELRSVNPGTRVSPELARAVARALEKDPERRYQSMEEMIEDLRALPELPRTSSADSHVPPTWAMSAPPPPPKTSTSPVESRARTRSAGGSARNPRTLAAVAAAVVLTGALALTLWIKGTPSGSANEEALRVTSLAPREGELAASKAAPAPGAARQPPAVEPPALAAQQPTAAAGSTVLVTLRTLPVGARA
ncbi:MAG TPA: serine/threonine-protein kinase, partial [Polyangiales bacterium]|nr:serine/threonine-protein kinase [Polyangiales bacterium]